MNSTTTYSANKFQADPELTALEAEVIALRESFVNPAGASAATAVRADLITTLVDSLSAANAAIQQLKALADNPATTTTGDNISDVTASSRQLREQLRQLEANLAELEQSTTS